MSIDMKRSLPRPPGHHSITPGFSGPQTAHAIAFLEQAFGAKVLERYDGPNGIVFHAEILVGDSVVMCGNGEPGSAPSPGMFSYYVANGEAVDETYRRALATGAQSISEPKNQFYGYRSACVKDPAGNRWTICAIVEQVSPAELERRMKEMKP